MGERRGVYRVLVRNPEGKRPLRRPRCRWEDNINIQLQGVGLGDIDWIDLAQDKDRWWALVNAVMNSDVGRSVHHHTIEINQPTRCSSFTSLLLDVYGSLNMFRAPPRPSSGAYNCINSLWFYLGTWWYQRCCSWPPDHDQKRWYHHAPTVIPEAANAVISS